MDKSNEEFLEEANDIIKDKTFSYKNDLKPIQLNEIDYENFIDLISVITSKLNLRDNDMSLYFLASNLMKELEAIDKNTLITNKYKVFALQLLVQYKLIEKTINKLKASGVYDNESWLDKDINDIIKEKQIED